MLVSRLVTLSGETISEWWDTSDVYDVLPAARNDLADWGNCPLSAISLGDTEDEIDVFCIDGEPVARLTVERHRIH